LQRGQCAQPPVYRRGKDAAHNVKTTASGASLGKKFQPEIPYLHERLQLDRAGLVWQWNCTLHLVVLKMRSNQNTATREVFLMNTWAQCSSRNNSQGSLAAVNAKSAALMLAVGAAVALVFTGCASKNYVRNQTTPLINQTTQLEDQTAANHRDLDDLSQRTDKGLAQAQSAADAASQKAQAAGSAATQAQSSAQQAIHQADSLSSLVGSLDSYHPVADVQVHFAFNKANLTQKDKEQLDQFASQLSNFPAYILEVTGSTDSIGGNQYNYQLSQMRAEAVVQYLATKYNVPAHRFYLIGIGKDKSVASNRSASGRAENRRVEVQLLSNNTTPNPAPDQSAGTGKMM
jgi:OOP family OmpA-OmpF porin